MSAPSLCNSNVVVPIAPSPRTKASHSTAAPPLIAARIHRLLPQSTQRAAARVAGLKEMFQMPREATVATHRSAMARSVQRLRLQRSVRNIRVSGGAGGPPAAGTMCLPLRTCTALPGPYVLTGSVDGLLTAWDAKECRPICSRSTYANAEWGRVEAMAATTGGLGGNPSDALVFTASMFQRGIRAWRWTAAPQREIKGTGNEEAELQLDVPTLDPLSLPPTSSAHDVGDIQRSSRIRQMAVDPTNTILATAGDDATLQLWDVHQLTEAAVSGAAPSLQLLLTQDGYETAGKVLGVAFHPDGSLLSTSDAGGRVVTWDTRSGQLAFCTGGRVGGHLSAAHCIAWSPCGVRLASGGADAVVHLYDARRLARAASLATTSAEAEAAAAPFQLLGHDDTVTSLSFYTNPIGDGGALRRLLPIGILTTSLDQTMRLWDADTGLCARTFHSGMPLNSHCRPAIAPAASGDGISASVMVVGHGKQWLLYDVPAAELEEVADDSDGANVVVESNLVAMAQGGGSMEYTTAPAAVSEQQFGRRRNEERDTEDDSENDDDDDEMLLLMKKKPTSSITAAGKEVEEDLSSSSSSEDEMEALRRKK